jgi:hypothetical protein
MPVSPSGLSSPGRGEWTTSWSNVGDRRRCLFGEARESRRGAPVSDVLVSVVDSVAALAPVPTHQNLQTLTQTIPR